MNNIIGQSLGRYHILEQLGEGGMATVYKAYDTQLERDVAIKFIRKDIFSPLVLDRVLKRFEREAKSLARLTHPNIVHIHDYGEFEGMPYLVMEYLAGGTLKERMGKPVPWMQAVQILLPIARALQFAHGCGIVHRDIKPSNILITNTGEPLLSDFGIAKLLESEDAMTLTASGVGVGTPEYMAPEQGLGHAVDGRADLYSLGIVLYELITGRKPFSADTPMAVVLKQLNDPLPRPKQYVRDIPDAVERLLVKSLAKRPEDRYENIAELVKRLEELLASGGKRISSESARSTSAAFDTMATFDQLQAGRPPLDKPGINWNSIISSRPFKYALAGSAVFLGALCVLAAGLYVGAKFMNPTAGIPVTPSAVFVSAPISASPVSTVAWTASPVLPTPTEPPTATSLPSIPAGAADESSVDGMTLHYVPAGAFMMGSNDSYDDERPVHQVYLDAYWMDETEVTNEKYRQCVSAGACSRPVESTYFSDNDYAYSPVAFVTWQNANSYCQWAGRRLPTEAEWEKGARGTDGRIYPWGDSFSCAFGNFDDEVQFDKDVVPGGPNCDGFLSFAPVGSFPDGQSPYGLMDMAGNAWEWVGDWYSRNSYAQSASENPTGPASGSEKVVRSGSWNYTEVVMRTTNRLKFSPSTANHFISFRCVVDASR